MKFYALEDIHEPLHCIYYELQTEKEKHCHILKLGTSVKMEVLIKMLLDENYLNSYQNSVKS